MAVFVAGVCGGEGDDSRFERVRAVVEDERFSRTGGDGGFS